jgi:hypothetical protein
MNCAAGRETRHDSFSFRRPYFLRHLYRGRISEKPHQDFWRGVHIFRFEDNRIAELWDIGQPISKTSPNENGPF